jgi:hypothetical protein
MLFTLETNFIKQDPWESVRRDWKFFSKEKLCTRLSAVEWDIDILMSKNTRMHLRTKLSVLLIKYHTSLFLSNKVKESKDQKQIENI